MYERLGMVMKIKNKIVLGSTEALKELMENPDIPIKTSFKLIKNVKKIDLILESCNEANKKLLEKYGEKNEDGTLKIDEKSNAKIPLEYMNDYLRERNELLETENDIDIDVITIEELAIEKLKPSILMAIDFMIDLT